MTGGPLRGLAWTALALDLTGAQVASHDRLAAEPFRIGVPSWIPAALVIPCWGTALSGPLAADAALLAMAPAADRGNRGARRAVAGLAVLRVVGVLGEPVSWGRRRPRWAMSVAAAHLILGVALGRSACRAA